MNRFSNHRGLFARAKKFTNVSILLFVLLFAVFLFGVNNLGQSSVEKQRESLETALLRDIVHCYAVEGAYPPSLSYIKSHYGLTYNEDLFFVDYRPIASNLLPDYTIIERKQTDKNGN